MKQVLYCLGKIRIVNEIKQNSAYEYGRRVIEQVNEEEAKKKGKKNIQ